MRAMTKRLLWFALVSGCAGASNEATEPDAPAVAGEQSNASAPAAANAHVAANAAPEPATTSNHDALVAAAARDFKAWKLVDDEFHWAPGLCRMPTRGGQHISKADGAAHDGKLFLLWARDIDRYATTVGWLGKDSPQAKAQARWRARPGDVVQVLVKESFVAKEFDPAKPSPQRNFDLHSAMRDGKPFVPGDPIGLFVMIELAGNPEGTDAGWIYGTVAPDGAVTSATDTGACRDCHSQRDNRLFGLPRPPAMGM